MDNQELFVHYQDKTFMANSSLLYNSSRKFRELVDHINNNQLIHLNINNDKFSIRNIENFLKICQNQPTDVQDSELEEICLIAKMFQADQIYNTGINFIRSNINPNFMIADDQFDEFSSDDYLQIKLDTEMAQVHHVDLNDLEFEESSESNISQKENEKSNDVDLKNNNNNINSNNTQTVCYQITNENPFMKCSRYFLIKNGKTICMAKNKDDEIFIGDGDDFHISENRIENAARMYRNREGINIVQTDDQEIKIKYISYGNKYSISPSFFYEGRKLNLIPKKEESLASFKGAYNRIPIESKRNIILQDSSNQCTFIVRKMSKKIFEIECNQNMKPIIAFAIALSEIIGPISMQYY